MISIQRGIEEKIPLSLGFKVPMVHNNFYFFNNSIIITYNNGKRDIQTLVLLINENRDNIFISHLIL